MAQQTVTAFFDRRSDATAAVSKIEALGIARANISLAPESDAGVERSDRAAYDHDRDEGGFWASLGNLFLPDEDRYAYAEGMSRGGVTVSVTAEEAHASRVIDILEEHGSVDMDERESLWKREGWAGYAPSGATTGGNSATYAAQGRSSAAAATTAGDSEVIPIVEEELRVGKRVSDQGRVRIRSYVRETPVQEQVTLRDETVRVERRPVDRGATGADATAFRDRTIEVEEHREEAVVSKEARVKEEIVVRKDVENRTETVSDTVRHTEVDIEDERTDRSATGTTGRVDPTRRR